MKKTIGIISYFPDNLEIRKNRQNKLNTLLLRCSIIFPNIPILIIAQNWKTFSPELNKNTSIFYFDNPLGIVGARKMLRRVFLESTDYDYLIMLDDDCEVSGPSGLEYLKQIDNNPDCFIEFNKTLLKLFAVSRSLLSKVDFDDNINPELGEGFEDRIFVNKLRVLFPDKKRQFINTGINEFSISTRDKDSTWYNNQDISSMLSKTKSLIEEYQDTNSIHRVV